MSQFSVFINAPDYLHQWLKNEFWDDASGRVVFPQGSAPRAVLKSLLRSRPKGWTQGDTDGLLPVEVPTFKGLNPARFNYLSKYGQAALVAACKDLFQSVMFLELSPLFSHDVQITNVIYDFMDRHGIDRDPKEWETIRQMYYRLRKKTYNR